MNIGEKIKFYRRQLNLSQRELARRVDISGQMVSKIENDLTNPSVETLNKIAAALGVTINALLGVQIKTLTDYSTQELLDEIKRRCVL